jgi:hypothetical protein
MNGFNVLTAGTVGTNPGTGWQIKGSGDFNNDGKSDILWQHADGTAGIWLMDGMTVLNQGPVGTNPGPSWHVMGSGDYNNDQRSDILWQNDNGPGRPLVHERPEHAQRRRRRLVQSRAGVAHHRVTARAASARRDGARRARRRSRSLSATRADATLGAESESRVCRAAGVGFLRMTELLFLRPFDRVRDHALGRRGIAPAEHLHPLARLAIPPRAPRRLSGSWTSSVAIRTPRAQSHTDRHPERSGFGGDGPAKVRTWLA